MNSFEEFFKNRISFTVRDNLLYDFDYFYRNTTVKKKV